MNLKYFKRLNIYSIDTRSILLRTAMFHLNFFAVLKNNEKKESNCFHYIGHDSILKHINVNAILQDFVNFLKQYSSMSKEKKSCNTKVFLKKKNFHARRIFSFRDTKHVPQEK